MSKRAWQAIPRRAGEMRHHVIAEARVRRERGDPYDPRNCLVLPWPEHFAHHGPNGKLHLSRVPDAAFAFAAETLGPGAAYNYLRRHYAGEDPRLDALLEHRPAATDTLGSPAVIEGDPAA